MCSIRVTDQQPIVVQGLRRCGACVRHEIDQFDPRKRSGAVRRAMVSRAGVSAGRRARSIAVASMTILAAGCAGGGGVQPKVEALSAGRSLSAKDRADAEAYNRILNQYLGARCHV